MNLLLCATPKTWSGVHSCVVGGGRMTECAVGGVCRVDDGGCFRNGGANNNSR